MHGITKGKTLMLRKFRSCQPASSRPRGRPPAVANSSKSLGAVMVCGSRSARALLVRRICSSYELAAISCRSCKSKAALEGIDLASAPLIPNFAKRVPRSDAKFGIGALVGVSTIALMAQATGGAQAQSVALDPITVVATKTEEKAIDTLAGVSVLRQRDIDQ